VARLRGHRRKRACSSDKVVRTGQGVLALADAIPGARLPALETRGHPLLEPDERVAAEYRTFLTEGHHP
jgi:hypothetical protein